MTGAGFGAGETVTAHMTMGVLLLANGMACCLTVAVTDAGK